MLWKSFKRFVNRILEIIEMNQAIRAVEVSNPQQKNINDEFKIGISTAWDIMQIALFKMYKENEILDFDSMFVTIFKTAQSLSGNPNDLKKWQSEYMEYLNSKGNLF